MKIRILGSGASFGSPLAYGFNGKIDINNSHNFRTRPSILISFTKIFCAINNLQKTNKNK